MLILSDSKKPERAMSDCQGQLPLREQQAEVSNFVKLYQNCVLQALLLLLVKKSFVPLETSICEKIFCALGELNRFVVILE